MTDEFDSKYALLGGNAEADAVIDEFIATLTIGDLAGVHDHVCEAAWDLVERCITFSVARGIDIGEMGITDTASRECFFDAACDAVMEARRNATPASPADEAVETLLNGNISDARDLIILNRTPHEVAVFTIDVLAVLARRGESNDRGERWYEAAARLRRCVNGYG